MADARASGHMERIRQVITRWILESIRFARWSLSSVEDEPGPHVVPLPGPAHGPVPAIEFRVETPRRKAS